MESTSNQLPLRVRTRAEHKKWQAIQQQKIVLIGSNLMKKYYVYSDKDIGIPHRYQKKLNQAKLDEDNESDEQTIKLGLKKSIKILTKYVKQQSKHKNKTQMASTCEQSLKDTQSTNTPKQKQIN